MSYERLVAREFAHILTTIKPVCTCCEICADKASDEIMMALDTRGWAIVDEACLDEQTGVDKSQLPD